MLTMKRLFKLTTFWVLGLLVLYLGSYFLTVEAAVWLPGRMKDGGMNYRPAYFGMRTNVSWIHAIFRPIHEVDRRLRPDMWNPMPGRC